MERRTLHTSFNQRRNIFIQQFKKSWLIVVFGVMLLIAGIFVLLNNEVLLTCFVLPFPFENFQ